MVWLCDWSVWVFEWLWRCCCSLLKRGVGWEVMRCGRLGVCWWILRGGVLCVVIMWLRNESRICNFVVDVVWLVVWELLVFWVFRFGCVVFLGVWIDREVVIVIMSVCFLCYMWKFLGRYWGGKFLWVEWDFFFEFCWDWECFRLLWMWFSLVGYV